MMFEKYTPLNEVLNMVDTKSLLCQMADAVWYLRTCSIIHRDIKPGNILCKHSNSGFQFVLADFGNAIFYPTDDRGFAGTLNYMAPEMLDLGQDYDFGVDIWGLGVVIAEKLTQVETFFEGEDRVTVLQAILLKFGQKQNTFPFTNDDLLNNLLQQMLEVNPLKRITIDNVVQCKYLM